MPIYPFSFSTALAFPTDDVVDDDDAELKFKQEAHRLKVPWAKETDFFIKRLRDKYTWPRIPVFWGREHTEPEWVSLMG